MRNLKLYFLLTVVGCVAILAAGSAALAGMESANYQIPNDVMSGGGSAMSSTSYQLNATLGQSSPLGNAMSTNYDNYPGFWQGDESVYDPDADGLTNADEYYYLTDPYNPDTDGDQVNDGDEVGLDMDPFYWDSDGDGLPDKFEYDNMSGHDPGENLDPIVKDGNTDFDSDYNPNVHEYWNGTDPWSPDPTGHIGSVHLGCAYWGDANGNCVTGSGDINELQSGINGMSVDYSNVIPDTSDTHDFNQNGILDSADFGILQRMIAATEILTVESRAADIEVFSEPGDSAVAVGDTCHVTVGVLSEHLDGDKYTSGFGVIFQVGAASTGTADIWGGDGEYSGYRYDFSGPVADGGKTRVTLRIKTAGTIYIEPYIPECNSGEGPYQGRYCPEILGETIEIQAIE